MIRRYLVAALSFIFTYLFFIEYLSPLRQVHIPYDLQGFHYPLVDYAFQALKDGRFPEWDWTIYCGQSFVGNIQAALFYPPTWLLFAANIAYPHVSWQSLQVFEFAHVWLAFLLCYAWLRGKRLEPLACLFGAGVFAYSGYMLLQLQHEGLIGAYTWFPLGFWGIDQAVESKGWRPFWKLSVASALCFLAGYPPTWVVFAVSMLAYALFSKSSVKATIGTIVSLAASFALSMVQLLPTLEATSLKSARVALRRRHSFLGVLSVISCAEFLQLRLERRHSHQSGQRLSVPWRTGNVRPAMPCPPSKVSRGYPGPGGRSCLPGVRSRIRTAWLRVWSSTPHCLPKLSGTGIFSPE